MYARVLFPTVSHQQRPKQTPRFVLFLYINAEDEISQYS